MLLGDFCGDGWGWQGLHPAGAQHLTAPPPAMQQVLDNLGSLPNATGAAELDLIFLRGIMESPIVRSLAKVWCIREVGGVPGNGACGRSHLKGCGRVLCMGDEPERAVGGHPLHLPRWLVRGGGRTPAREREEHPPVLESPDWSCPSSLWVFAHVCQVRGRLSEKRKL